MAPLHVRSNGRVIVPRAIAVASGARAQSPQESLLYGLPVPDATTTQLPAGISLCMIVKDEERFLEACLRSVSPHVDEICIVDTGSTDRTKEIAAEFGARVVQRAWRDDFAWARNEALAMATKRWIFVLDADEELDAAAGAVFKTLRTVSAGVTGLWVRCNNLSDDYKGTGVSSHALVRFFPNNERIRYMSPVHEFVTVDGQPTGIEAKVAPLSITHHGYLSEIVKLRNKSQRNLALVETATVTDPHESFNWYNLGTTRLLCGDSDGAIEAFEKMRVMVGESQRGFVPNALAQLADLYIEAGNSERAIELANESLRKAPNFANAHFALGRALVKLERYTEARTAFEAAIADAAHAVRQFIVDDEVSTWKAHSEIGSSYGSEGNDVAALEWFERALVARPLVVPIRMNRAKALERLERYTEAAAAFAALAQDEPGDAHSVDYINYLLRRRDYSAAIHCIDNVLPVVTPRAAASLLTTSAKLEVELKRGNGEALIERAVAAHPGAADALEALEALYRSRGDFVAIDNLHAAELTAPLGVAADYSRRATRFLSLQRLAEAEAVIRTGLEGSPADIALRYNLGVVLVQTARKEAAIDELARAGSVGDVGLRATFLRAIVLGDLGRYSDALEAVDAVLAVAPNEVDAWLYRFRFTEALGQNSEAELTLRRALRLGDPRVAAQLATWLLGKGRFDDARSVATSALQAVGA